MDNSRYVNVVIPPLPQTFTYGVLEEFSEKINVGDRVEVSFGHRRTSGFVVSEVDTAQKSSINNKNTYKVKFIEKDSSPHPCFKACDISFYKWIAEYYSASLSDVLDVAIPHRIQAKTKRFLIINSEMLGESESLRGKQQQKIFQFVSRAGQAVYYNSILTEFPGSAATIKKLVDKKIFTVVTTNEAPKFIEFGAVPNWAKPSVDLSESQKDCTKLIITALDNKKNENFLLHGVTGSGKTEIYIEAIQHARSLGKSALVLVPEIALTPQLIDRFRARLGHELVVLHSALSKRERWDAWQILLEEKSVVAIGARSAIFAPLHDLGIIIVDEEHDHSYKQAEGLRYNARDIAVMRGKFQSIPVILGSATPSLESFHNALSKKYHYMSIHSRYAKEAKLAIEIVDLNRISHLDMVSKNISPRLFQAIQEATSRNEQVFILYNRRGFASYLQCERCEAVVTCPNCSVTLTYHQDKNNLVCHYCNLTLLVKEHCTSCLSNNIPGKLSKRGAGTERVYDELKQLFPKLCIDRLDRDAASNFETYKNILNNLRSGKTNILVGTQMIAKGHDLPKVTLVGMVDCDVGLHMPDFRASERIFQLLTQASGRAGRHENPGQVILQTRVPTHASLVMTAKQDYLGFAKHELSIRKELSYPPFTRLTRVIASSSDKHAPGQLLATLKNIALKIAEENKFDLTILGPACAPLEKLKTAWRWHLLIKGKSLSQLIRLNQTLKEICYKQKKIKVVFDIDPQEML